MSAGLSSDAATQIAGDTEAAKRDSGLDNFTLATLMPRIRELRSSSWAAPSAALLLAWHHHRVPTVTAEQAAAAFIGILARWLKPEQMEQVRRRNCTAEYAGCCASHDFCDANVAMEQALISLGLHTYDSEDHDSAWPEMCRAYWDAWHAGWSLAKTKEFQLN